MSSYILRDVPAVLWRSVKARSVSDQLPLRSVFMRLLLLYATGQVTLHGIAPAILGAMGPDDELNGEDVAAASIVDVSTILMDESDVESLLRDMGRIVAGLEKIHDAIVVVSDKQVPRG